MPDSNDPKGEAQPEGARPPQPPLRPRALPASAATPLVTPIFPSVVYRSVDADEMDAQYEGRLPGYTYSREGHVNATVLARRLAAMEGVPEAAGPGVVTGSGMGAVAAVLLGLLQAGDHVVASDQLYGRTLRLMARELPRLGIATSLVDATDAAAVAAAMRPETRMVLVEVVSNPTIRVADMPGIVAAARAAGAVLVVDNTFTTPFGYAPLAEGAQVVLHSVTKLLAGHSDAMLGWVGTDTPERAQAVREAAETWGFTGSPFDCWLAERGLASFPLRHARASANAAVLADRLAAEPSVEAVLYPGRPEHPDHNRVARVLGETHGTMLSFRMRGGRAEVNRFLRAAEALPFAPTLGDVATTLSHPASSSHRALDEAARAALGITEGFIRVSVGVEEPQAVGDALIGALREATA